MVKRSAVAPEMMVHEYPAREYLIAKRMLLKQLQAERLWPEMLSLSAMKARKGGPGMREMLNPTSAIAGMGLGSRRCADHRRPFFGGASRGASIGHVSPEAAVGGPIALIEEGDIIKVNIPANTLDVDVSDEELAQRKEKWQPREPKITTDIWPAMRPWLPQETEGAILEIPGNK